MNKFKNFALLFVYSKILLYICSPKYADMWIYFLMIRIAALFGHRKARLIIKGQREVAKQTAAPLMWGESQGEVYPSGAENCERPIWFHSASVGEFEQARPIIEKLRQERPHEKILLTFFSPSGYELRKNYGLVDKVLYLPFATPLRVKKFLDAVQPKMAIFVKYEFWPAYLKEIHKRGIPLYSVSAIFRPDQLFFKPWGKWYLRLLGNFDYIFVQDEASKLLLENALGALKGSDKKSGAAMPEIVVSGDTRFDRVVRIASGTPFLSGAETQTNAVANPLRLVEQFVEGCGKVLVAGSTWPQDEALLAQYVAARPDVKLVLVPHEIDSKHLHYIFNLFEGRMMYYSETRNYMPTGVRVLVIDTIGMLSSIYRYGHVAYIGGGFGVGIHNTIEAAVYGMPVIFGPHYERFREAKDLIRVGAAASVKTYPQLETVLDNAFARHEEMGKNALEYVESELGATERIYNAIIGA